MPPARPKYVQRRIDASLAQYARAKQCVRCGTPTLQAKHDTPFCACCTVDLMPLHAKDKDWMPGNWKTDDDDDDPSGTETVL